MSNSTDRKLAELRSRISNKKSMNKGLNYKKMYLLDVSSSMVGEKLDTAKVVLDDKIKSGDGLIVFGEDVYHVDYTKLKSIMAHGQTSMLPAIKLALQFKPSELVLITDGEANKEGYAPDIIDFITMVTGVKIHTIGIGDWCDNAFLEVLAEMTGGEHNAIMEAKELHGVLLRLEAPQQAIAL